MITGGQGGSREDVGVGIETAVWRALAVFRLLGLLYAVAVYVRRVDEYAHPVGGWVVLGLMAAWTVAAYLAYSRPSGRTWPVLGLDLAIAMGAVVASRWLDDVDRIEAGAQTLPVVWAAAPVLAFALRGGWPAGLGAAVGVGAADLVHRGALTVPTANNIVLLLLAGAVVGYTMSLARRGELALARALAVQAAARERERLSREIHDNVLQVLALVGRRGQEAGGEAAEIGRLAAEQEQALRALVTAPPDAVAGEVDLRGLLATYASSAVTVSTPATPVVLTAARARELAAAVGAALANVALHAGEAARAWVLVEDDGDEVVVSVRDDGGGMAAGRLEEAAADGRLGVASSIEGRLRELGGTMAVESAPGAGTEVEMRVPR
jgi:signal transduction histidine kinase